MLKVGSLGVGVQSSAMYFLSSLGILPRLDLFIFADTGGEKSKTLEYYKFMQNWQKNNNGIPLLRANFKNILSDLLNTDEKNRYAAIPAFCINEDGEKAMLRRQCTSEYKIQQFNKKYREYLELGNKNFPQTEIWLGISHEERDRMAIPKEKWKINVYPFCGYKIFPDGHNERIPSFIKNRNSLIKFFIEYNLPIPEKSSCVFCPFQGDFSWKQLKDTSLVDFNKAVEVDNFLRSQKKGKINSEMYLHHSLKPLKDIKFKNIQKGLFDLGNCSDNCNT